MTEQPRIITGLREIAGDYDALICDVWGVVHDGMRPHWPAVEALRLFRAERGRVVLFSNAPRLPAAIERQFTKIGMPLDCYDAIVSSGRVARDDITHRASQGKLGIVHLGPERDINVFEGLNVELAEPGKASIILATGFLHDDTETAEDYRDTLVELRRHGLLMVCANPDEFVPRGKKLVPCAGGLARIYASLGGEVVYYGKPYLPIYKEALEAAGSPKRALVVGDGLDTDILGANAAGIETLFIADGVHSEELGAFTPENLTALFAKKGVRVDTAIHALTW